MNCLQIGFLQFCAGLYRNSAVLTPEQVHTAATVFLALEDKYEADVPHDDVSLIFTDEDAQVLGNALGQLWSDVHPYGTVIIDTEVSLSPEQALDELSNQGY